MTTEELIDHLGREATIVKPLPTPGRRAAVWLLWGAIYLTVVAVIKSAVMSSWELTVTLLFLLQQAAALLTGITAAWAALTSVIPGVHNRVWGPPFASASIWIALVLWEAVSNFRVAGTFGATSESDWPCVASMTMGGVVLGGALMWMLRRGAPLAPRTTAFLAGLGALSVANIEACLARPHAIAMTVLLWHGTTAAIAALVCAGMGRHWLRWPDMIARSS